MRKYLKNYYFDISILTIALGILARILFRTLLKEFYFPEFWILLLFFFLLHLGSHIFISVAKKKNKPKFNTAYLISFSIKFISYLVFLIIYLVQHKSISYSFAIALFILYIVYTVFDVRSSLIISKSSEKNFEKSD